MKMTTMAKINELTVNGQKLVEGDRIGIYQSRDGQWKPMPKDGSTPADANVTGIYEVSVSGMRKPEVRDINVQNVKSLLKQCPNEVQEYVRSLEGLRNSDAQILKAAKDQIFKLSRKVALSEWIDFDVNDRKTWPGACRKYLICRKDGKIHWETWNGTGWAYNHNEIRHWAEITSPVKKGV